MATARKISTRTDARQEKVLLDRRDPAGSDVEWEEAQDPRSTPASLASLINPEVADSSPALAPGQNPGADSLFSLSASFLRGK